MGSWNGLNDWDMFNHQQVKPSTSFDFGNMFNFGGNANAATNTANNLAVNRSAFNSDANNKLAFGPNTQANAAMLNAPSVPPVTPGGGLWNGMKNMFTADNFKTAGGLASGLGQLASGVANWKTLGLSEDAFNFQKDVTLENMFQQKNLIANELEDRNNSRYIWSGGAGNPNNGYSSPDDYTQGDEVREGTGKLKGANAKGKNKGKRKPPRTRNYA